MKKLILAYLLPVVLNACGQSMNATPSSQHDRDDHALPLSEDNDAPSTTISDEVAVDAGMSEPVIPEAPPLAPPLLSGGGVNQKPGLDWQGRAQPLKSLSQKKLELEQEITQLQAEKAIYEGPDCPSDFDSKLKWAGLQDRLDQLLKAQAEFNNKKTLRAGARAEDSKAGKVFDVKVKYLGREGAPLLVHITGLDPERNKKAFEKVLFSLSGLSRKYEHLAKSIEAMTGALAWQAGDSEESLKHNAQTLMQALLDRREEVVQAAKTYDEVKPEDLMAFYAMGYISADVWSMFWDRQPPQLGFLRDPSLFLGVLDLSDDMLELRAQDESLNKRIAQMNEFAGGCQKGGVFFDALKAHFGKEKPFQNLFAAKSLPHTLQVFIKEANLTEEWSRDFLKFIDLLKNDNAQANGWIQKFNLPELDSAQGFVDFLSKQRAIRQKLKVSLHDYNLQGRDDDFRDQDPLADETRDFINTLTLGMDDQWNELDQMAMAIKKGKFAELCK